MALLRISISLLALASAIGVSYFAVWEGLGGDSSLSPANTAFAVWTGLIYGGILMILVNIIPYRNRKSSLKIAAFSIIGLHLIFGFGFMIFIAAVAGA